MACTVIGTSPWPVMKMIGVSAAIHHELLELEATEIGKADVEHEAVRHTSARLCQKVVRRRAQYRQPSREADRQLERLTHRDIVIDDEDDRLGMGHVVPVPRSATASAFNSAASLKGLNRHSAAPSAMQRQRTLESWFAVMNTTGIDSPRLASSTLKLRPRHPGHRNVEQQTVRPLDDMGREKILGRWERLNAEAQLLEEIGERLAHGLVIIDDAHQGNSRAH